MSIGTEAIAHVLSTCAEIHMRGITTDRVIAEMIDAQAILDRTIRQNPCLAASVDGSTVMTGQTVTGGLCKARPGPALSRSAALNLAPERRAASLHATSPGSAVPSAATPGISDR